MIPSDHFVRFYNEVFKFLDEEKAIPGYYAAIAKGQEDFYLELFRTKGLKGMYEYWKRIEHEENCDLDLELTDDCFTFTMHTCPSLSKVTDNDAGPYERYCDHCPGWVLPLIEKAGYVCEYNLVDRRVPKCQFKVYPKSSGKTSRVFLEPLPEK